MPPETSGPITIERFIAFVVTPALSGLCSWFVPWAADNLPGHPQYSASDLSLLSTAGATVGLAAGITWLVGRMRHNRDKAEVEKLAQRNASDRDVGALHEGGSGASPPVA